MPRINRKHKSVLFACGSGISQAAITPQGELKSCLMIDSPRYKILKKGFSPAWEELKKFSRSIKPDKRYRCPSCKLNRYCKWCPARSWLYNRTFTACVPELKTCAQRLAQVKR